MRSLKNKNPVCVVSGEEDGIIVFRPRIVDNPNRRLPDLVVDVVTAEGICVASGVSMRQLAKLDEFITAAYDWRRWQIMRERRHEDN